MALDTAAAAARGGALTLILQHAMDLRNQEMEEYCPPPDFLDLLEELKIPQHLDKLTELG
ncbi:hypothetical protein T492DRAFT_892484 [Pavlovales sp. CCMP2436]|nr:hypothetical protein T492DRAFT_892484 [Pavlovales sp. CCMP2436]